MSCSVFAHLCLKNCFSKELAFQVPDHIVEPVNFLFCNLQPSNANAIGLLKLLLPPHAQWTWEFMTGSVEFMTGQCSFELQWEGERVHNQLPELGSMHWIHWARSHIPLPLLKHSTWTRQSVLSWGKNFETNRKQRHHPLWLWVFKCREVIPAAQHI